MIVSKGIKKEKLAGQKGEVNLGGSTETYGAVGWKLDSQYEITEKMTEMPTLESSLLALPVLLSPLGLDMRPNIQRYGRPMRKFETMSSNAP